MATFALIVLAVLVTLLCMAIGAYYYWREQQLAEHSFIDELDDTAYMDVDLHTPERELYDKMSAAFIEDPPRVTRDQLSGALLRRAMAIVPYIERVEKDRPSVRKLSQNNYIPFSIVDELQEAEGLLEQEIKDVQADAENLRPGWGRGIYAQAYDIVRRQRQQAETDEGASKPSLAARKPEASGAAAPTAPTATPAAPSAASAPAADTPPFAWSQTSDELELTLSVPAATKPKDVRVKFGVQSCSISIGGAAPVLSGRLAGKVNVDECTWTLSGDGAQRKLQVTLFKQAAVEWAMPMADE
jgi:hypothetical protein